MLATKFGNEVDDQGARTSTVNGRPAYVRNSVDGSLRRLGLDVIDLYYQHPAPHVLFQSYSSSRS